MMMTEQFRQLARYNTWMNEKVYGEAAALDERERKRDLGAFFTSLHGTLAHILWADRIWLWRFTEDAEIGVSRDRDDKAIPIGMHDQVLYEDFGDLRRERAKTDAHIERWVDGLDDARLAGPMSYKNMSGAVREHPLWMAATHFFNHETHHRGQATTLLKQLGRDPGVTDFMVFLWGRIDQQAKP